MLNSRIMGSKLPISFKNLKPNLVPKNVYEEMTKNLAVQKEYYDVNARGIIEFVKGERILIQDINSKIWKPAKIRIKLKQPRSYIVETEDKRCYRKKKCCPSTIK